MNIPFPSSDAKADAMRRILIDRARSKGAVRHGVGLKRVDVDGAERLELAAPAAENELLDVHEALDQFAEHHAQKAELVKLRYFAGLALAQAAEVLGINRQKAERHWAFARVWLFREISRQKEPQG